MDGSCASRGLIENSRGNDALTQPAVVQKDEQRRKGSLDRVAAADGEEQVLCSGPRKTKPGVLGEHGNPTCIESGAVQEKMFQGLTVATVGTVWTTTARESMETFGSPMAANSKA
ncbi:hypothetical protein MTO96_037446 [Rhipicephalus appendiculatus]